MQTITSITEMQQQVANWRTEGLRIGFVPTMGNLHAGHLGLVQQVGEVADRVVVSIFVNPLQFGEGEDIDAYPRTLDDDLKKLANYSVAAIFTPQEAEFYPQPRESMTFVEVPGLSDILCGVARLGHFRGVTTVVNKLFNIVQPHVAIFGEKDFQQLVIIRRMVEDLLLPVEIISGETVRENDGLAMSSRNGYLSEADRQCAPRLYTTLQEMRERLLQGEKEYSDLENQAQDALIKHGFRPDYVAIRYADNLQIPTVGEENLVILGAAWLGKTRLIDNLKV